MKNFNYLSFFALILLAFPRTFSMEQEAGYITKLKDYNNKMIFNIGKPVPKDFVDIASFKDDGYNFDIGDIFVVKKPSSDDYVYGYVENIKDGNIYVVTEENETGKIISPKNLGKLPFIANMNNSLPRSYIRSKFVVIPPQSLAEVIFNNTFFRKDEIVAVPWHTATNSYIYGVITSPIKPNDKVARILLEDGSVKHIEPKMLGKMPKSYNSDAPYPDDKFIDLFDKNIPVSYSTVKSASFKKDNKFSKDEIAIVKGKDGVYRYKIAEIIEFKELSDKYKKAIAEGKDANYIDEIAKIEKLNEPSYYEFDNGIYKKIPAELVGKLPGSPIYYKKNLYK